MRPKGKLLALIVMFAAVGLITASGAFTTVEADRTATINVTGDASALLQIQESNNAGIGNVSNAQGGEATIDLGESSVDDNGAKGLNPNANTTITPLINVTNQGTNSVDLTITIDTTNAPGIDAFNLTDSTGTVVSSRTLSAGETAELGVKIQTNSQLSGGSPDEVTITFNADEN